MSEEQEMVIRFQARKPKAKPNLTMAATDLRKYDEIRRTVISVTGSLEQCVAQLTFQVSKALCDLDPVLIDRLVASVKNYRWQGGHFHKTRYSPYKSFTAIHLDTILMAILTGETE